MLLNCYLRKLSFIGILEDTCKLSGINSRILLYSVGTSCFKSIKSLGLGYIVSPEVIMSHIKYVLEDQRPPNEYALGVLTTADRDKWATMRSQLCNAGKERMRKVYQYFTIILLADSVDQC